MAVMFMETLIERFIMTTLGTAKKVGQLLPQRKDNLYMALGF